jgi:hypothetical protein
VPDADDHDDLHHHHDAALIVRGADVRFAAAEESLGLSSLPRAPQHALVRLEHENRRSGAGAESGVVGHYVTRGALDRDAH